MFYEDYFIDILHGGKVQWCWVYEKHWRTRVETCADLVRWVHYISYIRVWSLTLLYYRVTTIRQLKAQVLQLAPLAHYSGFVLPGRGLHWHRQSKLRRN